MRLTLKMNSSHLLLLSLRDSWFDTFKSISISVGCAKMTFEGIHDLTLGEDVCRRSVGETSNSILSNQDIRRESNRQYRGSGRSNSRRIGGHNNRRDMTCWKCKESGHVKS